jgi:uncharacterized protein
MSQTPQSGQIDPQFLSMLRCPLTGSTLREEGDFLVAESGLRYPIRDGIPVMLIEETKLPAPFRTLEEFKASLGK